MDTNAVNEDNQHPDPVASSNQFPTDRLQDVDEETHSQARHNICEENGQANINRDTSPINSQASPSDANRGRNSSPGVSEREEQLSDNEDIESLGEQDIESKADTDVDSEETSNNEHPSSSSDEDEGKDEDDGKDEDEDEDPSSSDEDEDEDEGRDEDED